MCVPQFAKDSLDLEALGLPVKLMDKSGYDHASHVFAYILSSKYLFLKTSLL